MYAYVRLHLNTPLTRMDIGIEFNLSPGSTTSPPNYSYQVWFNVSSSANRTDVFGSQLLALERGLDEAISMFSAYYH